MDYAACLLFEDGEDEIESMSEIDILNGLNFSTLSSYLVVACVFNALARALCLLSLRRGLRERGLNHQVCEFDYLKN